MPPALARLLAVASAAANDPVTAAWLRSGRAGRVFAFFENGTFLVNVGPEGWSIEPGSTDHERLSLATVRVSVAIPLGARPRVDAAVLDARLSPRFVLPTPLLRDVANVLLFSFGGGEQRLRGDVDHLGVDARDLGTREGERALHPVCV
jgi:hypothetical protein